MELNSFISRPKSALLFLFILIACSANGVQSTKVTSGTTSSSTRIKKRTGENIFLKNSLTYKKELIQYFRPYYNFNTPAKKFQNSALIILQKKKNQDKNPYILLKILLYLIFIY